MIKTEPRKGGFKVFGSGGGGKSGGSSRTPVETPDSLHNISYAAILDVISNGEVYGPAHPSQPLRDIYLDGTPIQNEDGSLNFQSVESDYRVGTIDQEHIAGFPASVSVISVGAEITTSTPWTQQINGSELSAVRVSINVPQLLQTYDSGDNAGDRVGYKVEYAIDISSSGGAFENVITTSFNGKTVNGYTRTHRIELPSGNSFWTVRVRRITAESTSTTIQDAIYLDSYAEVIDGKFRHPMTAMIGVKIDAEQFQSIPTRAYHWKGRIIRVPSNYDPETRTYSGVWDGTFKSAYSNNPAWVFYDMLTNTLFGLGEYINAASVDRYALYQIGAYCDQMVDDGQGGLEPRFVCNCYIQSAQDALRVLNDLSSVFRGMAYWSDSQVIPVADMPSDPIYNYANANVIDGKFEYAGTDLKTRKTVALVSWNDPSNFYKSKVEVVEDSDGIARYGIRKTEVIAFGCTSRGQAQRIGLYLLYTSRMETGTVAFSVGLDGIIPQPGSIIKIADRNRAGRQIGGRISQSGANFIVTDREHPAKVGDTINVNLPSGTNESKLVSGIDGRKITVDSDFSSEPSKQSVWSIDADDLVTQQARVISVSEADGIQYDVNCVFHHPGKFSAIDSGVRLDPLPVSVVPPRTQNAPTNIQIAQFNTFKQGTTRQNAEITWDAPEYAVQYDVQWKRDNGDWVSVARTGTRTIQLSDIFAGEYIVRVRAINSLDVPSLWAYSSATQLDGIVGAPPAVTTLSATGQVMAITLEWSYPDTANIISQIEIRASLNNDFSASYPLTFAAYPATTFTVNGLGYGTEMWFWARLIDKNGLAGEWTPLSTGAGTYGKSSESASDILDYLQEQISESELAQSLADQITAGSEAAAAVEELTTIVTDLEDGLTANWQVKTQVTADGKVVQAGMGLGASIGADGTSRSEFLVMADTIGFLNSIDGQIHSPFVFDTVNDTAFLNTVFIGDATIDFAKITDTLQSNNYQAGLQGWRIAKNGAVEFSNGVFRGAVYANEGDFENVTINESCTIKGNLEGATGSFSGTVRAENIIGDLVAAKAVSLSRNEISNSWTTIGSFSGINNTEDIASLFVGGATVSLRCRVSPRKKGSATGSVRVIVNGQVVSECLSSTKAESESDSDGASEIISFSGAGAVVSLSIGQSFRVSIQVRADAINSTARIWANTDAVAQMFRNGSAFN
ncbi:host specificity protein J [Vibrio paracholerae]|uniref:host specificity protein J n=1 Tax=Vibrio paracholerae TaxID=650003 RepID=UPI002094DBBB|nr:phage tail protein [Vibrio paracholerae]MCO7020283.1 phage tail protein [Vibrio paracholerae]